jgi:pyruvate formate lyase activating enzyme
MHNEKTASPLVSRIKGYSLDDGPGIRSVVFFKGCPLDCVWCHNPETKKSTNELYHEKSKCIGCESCIAACPRNAISFTGDSFIDRDACRRCFQCADVCPPGALSRSGRVLHVDEIVGKLKRYKPFFDTSGGGVTLSGGEPCLHMDFISLLCRSFRQEGINILLQTCGLFDFGRFEELVLPFITEIYFDIKFISSRAHKKYCGVGNERILENFSLLQRKSITDDFNLTPRTPLIPNITDEWENLDAIIGFYIENGVKKTTLLPNNPAWMPKLEGLGETDTFTPEDPIRRLYSIEKKAAIGKAFRDKGIHIDFG